MHVVAHGRQALNRSIIVFLRDTTAAVGCVVGASSPPPPRRQAATTTHEVARSTKPASSYIRYRTRADEHGALQDHPRREDDDDDGRLLASSAAACGVLLMRPQTPLHARKR